MTTIYDIAKEANTSAATVSLALRNSGRVSEATRQRINGIAKQLSYRANPLACGLAGAKTRTIAFVFNFSSQDLCHDLSYIEYFHAIAQAAATKQYKIYFHSSMSALPVKDVLQEMTQFRVDGMILGSNLTAADRDALRTTSVPTVVVGRDIQAEKVTSVFSDDRDGMRQLVEHLLDLGHQRIAYVGKGESYSSFLRFDGFTNTLNQAGLSVDTDMVIESGYDIESGEKAGAMLAEKANPPTAIIGAGDQLAIGIIAGLKSKGLSVPDDISVAGYDNMHISRFTVPALTSVDLLRIKSGVTVIEALLGLISGKQTGTQLQTPVELIVRDSTIRLKP
jgi:LacI family transcriptional regulator